MAEKIIRSNEPCPCGSEFKFKNCHGDLKLSDARLKLQQEAKEYQRVQQQGLGKPIESWLDAGKRFVKVGDDIYSSACWKTFPDFLLDYAKHMFKPGWGNKEICKLDELIHPIIRMYQKFCHNQKECTKDEKHINFIQLNRGSNAFITFIYNIYLIHHHNKECMPKLLKRLKQPEHFFGAFYETYIIAMLIVSGFKIELEDESDRKTKHFEGTAIDSRGRKFPFECKSIEVKGQLGFQGDEKFSSVDKLGNKIKSKLKEGLEQKYTDEIKLLFIELNIPSDKVNDELWKKCEKNIAELEEDFVSENKCHRAYVVFTNHPFQYDMNAVNSGESFFITAFNVPSFMKFHNLEEELLVRKEHADIFRLKECMDLYCGKIPSTFDGANPVCEAKKLYVIKIGDRFPLDNGKSGIVKDALLVPNSNKAVYIVSCYDGSNIMCSVELDKDSIMAYEQHPETFFGKVDKKNNINAEYELYSFFYEIYKGSPKEKIIEFMVGASSDLNIKEMSQPDLARLYCIGLVYNIFSEKK
jgi:hypothetical protein